MFMFPVARLLEQLALEEEPRPKKSLSLDNIAAGETASQCKISALRTKAAAEKSKCLLEKMYVMQVEWVF